MPSLSSRPCLPLLALAALAGVACSDGAPTRPRPSTPPRAARDSVALFRGTAVRLPVTANDSGDAAFRLRIVAVGAPAHGSVTVEGDTLLLYRPTDGFVGHDSVRYQVGYAGADGADVDSAVVAIEVRPGPYRAQLLPSGGGRFPLIGALAANGDAVGAIWIDGAYVPVVWRQGAAPVRLPGVRSGVAVALDARGRILGRAEPAAGGCVRPVLWASAETPPVSLQSPGEEACSRMAVALGDDGTVVARDAVWRDGAWTRHFGTWHPSGAHLGYAYDVGPGGSVLVQSVESYSATWVWRDGGLTALPGIGGRLVRGEAMNALGHVAGYAERMGDPRGARIFLWRDGRTTPIEGAYGDPDHVIDLNAAGEILFEEYTRVPGTTIRGENAPWLAVNGTPFRLQTLLADPSLTLLRLFALNDDGVVAAQARRATGDTVAVLLRDG